MPCRFSPGMGVRNQAQSRSVWRISRAISRVVPRATTGGARTHGWAARSHRSGLIGWHQGTASTKALSARWEVEAVRTFRASGRVSLVVGWMLIGMGVAALVAVVILGFVVEPWLFSFLFAPVLLFVGGGINLWMGRRARLEIHPDGFLWCGFLGSPRSLGWRDVRQILLPPPGARRRLAAIALLYDGRYVDIDALWQSPTSPVNLAGAVDHRQAQQLLIDGHRTYLAHGASR